MRNLRISLAMLTALVLLAVSIPIMANAGKTYTGTITKDNIFFRSRPSTDSSWSRRFKKDDKVEVIAIEGDFYKAKYDGKTGYVMRKFVSLPARDVAALEKSAATTVKTDPLMNGITKISQITVPATSKKGNSGKNVLALQQALKIKGFYKAPINKKFDDATVAAVKAFQKSVKLTQTGEADFATIKKLFGKDAANYKPTPSPTPKKTPTPKPTATPKKTATPTPKPTATPKKTATPKPTATPKKTATPKPTATPKKTATPTPKPTATPKKTATPKASATEKLVWFNTGKNLFKAGATFQVKDVISGKVWTCQRLYAGNHLDAEPLTAADTAIMKAAYGGRFTYIRRPVLVRYNGHVYAGSMYGVPHGDYKIKDNDFDGQFCIHFTGSKTSGSNVVDSGHQAAVEKALQSAW